MSSAPHSVTALPPWSPTSWKERPFAQMPDYPDAEALQHEVDKLSKLPPLITSWDIEALREKLVHVEQGRAFLLQGGDCAESFADCTAPRIVNQLKVILQMSFILVHEMHLPVIRVARLAGQYAKPRSNDFETVDGVEMPTYRGDVFNGFEPTLESRTPDPRRLTEAYGKAGLTINFLRALVDEGFADLHHPEFWELDFMRNSEAYKEYEVLVKSISKTIKFMDSLHPGGPGAPATVQKAELFTSHEALNLHYESAQTRQVPRKTGWYNLSAHMLWVGNRTRQLDGGHIEYLRGIQNPIGIKCGPGQDPSDTVALLDRLNPTHESGKMVLISRMGAAKVEEELPGLIQAVTASGHPVIWSVDPMHGNTFSTNGNIKTRHFSDILDEIHKTFAIHKSEGSRLGGVHLELTGEKVTECVGGSKGLEEDGLTENYASLCDPRLNYEQSLELAFNIAKAWANGDNA
ncbi:MAG: 3-deoxy-7-phosphoheptulonate synthase class II [Rhodothermaceae bacterium TMED105]|nr:MAG: 3-deoxy-7-phosphoheptulonate synthase class II [Rhodothermaceae bacterium TMED105]